MPVRGNQYKCYYCGTEEKCTKDHFYPKSKGGKYLVWACRFCQSSKGNKMPINWLMYINNLNILTNEAKLQINKAVNSLIEVLPDNLPERQKPDNFDRFF